MANVKISGLTAAGSVANTNEFEINEAGTSKKVTGAQIAAHVLGGSYGATLTSLTVDTNVLHVDATNNRVGIGNTSPSVPLDVTGAAQVSGNLTVDTDTLFVDATNNRVGVGTSSPSAELHVNSGAADEVARFEGTGSPYISLYDSGTREFYIELAGSTINLFGQANKPMVFVTNSTEDMRLSTAGGLSIGTTADAGAGGLFATGNITAYYSDSRLKNNLGTIDNALDKVSKLSGIYYTNNDTANQYGYTSTEKQVGVIAQEVNAVLPEVVKAAPFDLDETGTSKSGENYLTVQYDRLVPLLIEAIKELKQEIEVLKETK
jgi:hypothetical protein